MWYNVFILSKYFIVRQSIVPIDTVPFSDHLNLIELMKILAVSVCIFYNIEKMEEYCDIVQSQQPREKIEWKVI